MQAHSAYEQNAFDEAAFNFLLLAEAGHEVESLQQQQQYLLLHSSRNSSHSLRGFSVAALGSGGNAFAAFLLNLQSSLLGHCMSYIGFEGLRVEALESLISLLWLGGAGVAK